jgi:hypothetical protein
VSDPVPAAADLGAWFRGRWSVRRAINGDAGRFTGTAEFTRQDSGATRWHESGELTLGAHRGPAWRTLELGPGGDRDGPWLVRFDDGRPFHDLDLSAGLWEPEHLCGPDVYRGRYEVLGADRLRVTWQVTGPGRADTIVSDYRRLAGEPDGADGGD